MILNFLNSVCCWVGGDIHCTGIHEDCPTCSTVFGPCHSWVCHCLVPAEKRISSIFHWKSLCKGIDIQGLPTHQPNSFAILSFTLATTVEPLTKDPPRKGHCMLNLSIRDTVWGPKNYHFLSLRTSEKRTTSL